VRKGVFAIISQCKIYAAFGGSVPPPMDVAKSFICIGETPDIGMKGTDQ
jgi:hypothetical protein